MQWKRLVFCTLLVVFFSGMDFPAILLIHGQLPIFPLPLEWWRPWTYTSLTGQLLWAPNHAIAIWLGTALVFRHRSDPFFYDLCLLLLPVLALWTPFAVFGLLPWMIWGRLSQREYSGRALLPDAFSIPSWTFATAMAVIIFVLFSAPGVGGQIRLDTGDAVGGLSASPLSFDNVVAYVQFAAFEFGILAMTLRPRQCKDERKILGIAVATLLALPLIRLGPSNDWILRVSTPSLLALLFLVLADFQEPRAGSNTYRLRVLAFVIAAGAITPLVELSRTFSYPRTPPNYGQTLIEQQGGGFPPHYIGRLHHYWTEWLFNPPSSVPEGHLRQSRLVLSPSSLP